MLIRKHNLAFKSSVVFSYQSPGTPVLFGLIHHPSGPGSARRGTETLPRHACEARSAGSAAGAAERAFLPRASYKHCRALLM